jgi:hypothetical protein
MNDKETTSTHRKDIQYVWGLISQSSAIDRERNNISLFNVIDQISVSSEGFAEDGTIKINCPTRYHLPGGEPSGCHLLTSRYRLNVELSWWIRLVIF